MFSKIFLGLLLTCTIATAQNTTASLYDIPLTDISGAPLDLSQFKGKKILFVNVNLTVPHRVFVCCHP